MWGFFLSRWDYIWWMKEKILTPLLSLGYINSAILLHEITCRSWTLNYLRHHFLRLNYIINCMNTWYGTLKFILQFHFIWSISFLLSLQLIFWIKNHCFLLQTVDVFAVVALSGIIRRLLGTGTVLVATSNRAPNDLNQVCSEMDCLESVTSFTVNSFFSKTWCQFILSVELYIYIYIARQESLKAFLA